MDTCSREELQSLLKHRRTPCVSLLMPTTRGPAQEDQARWKNHLRTAEELLRARERRSEAAELLTPARDLLNDVPF